VLSNPPPLSNINFLLVVLPAAKLILFLLSKLYPINLSYSYWDIFLIFYLFAKWDGEKYFGA